MKAAPFAYAKPGSLQEALALLERHGDRAKLLAGGQSLIAALNMRLATPSLLVDLTAIPGIDGIQLRGDHLAIGALVSHRAIERSELVAKHAPLLSQAAPHIAHVAIRNAGTIGGSLAMADPAAEWPACCVALEARIVAASPKGERRIPATQFFKSLFTTALAPREIITAVEVPVAGANTRSAFLELVRRRGDYAIVGLAALAQLERGALTRLRLVYLGVGDAPVAAAGAMAQLEGKRATPEAIAAAQAALEQDLSPAADLTHSATTKLHLARVLLGRALAALAP